MAAVFPRRSLGSRGFFVLHPSSAPTGGSSVGALEFTGTRSTKTSLFALFSLRDSGHETELFSRYGFALHRFRSETERREPRSFRRCRSGLRRRRQSGRYRHRPCESKAGSTRTRHEPYSSRGKGLSSFNNLSRRPVTPKRA